MAMSQSRKRSLEAAQEDEAKQEKNVLQEDEAKQEDEAPGPTVQEDEAKQGNKYHGVHNYLYLSGGALPPPRTPTVDNGTVR